jgi:hypothetical protein
VPDGTHAGVGRGYTRLELPGTNERPELPLPRLYIYIYIYIYREREYAWDTWDMSSIHVISPSYATVSTSFTSSIYNSFPQRAST